MNNLARFNLNSRKEHWTALKQVIRYLNGTINHGLRGGPEPIGGYSDPDWAGDLLDRKSTSGYVFMVSGGPVSWSSRKQKCIALTTAEAEYVALCAAVQECMWSRQLEAEISGDNDTPTVIFEDNQSTIAKAKNPQFQGRAKHIDIHHHVVREQLAHRTIQLEYCPTTEMTAGIFTKGLDSERFKNIREKAGILELHQVT